MRWKPVIIFVSLTIILLMVVVLATVLTKLKTVPVLSDQSELFFEQTIPLVALCPELRPFPANDTPATFGTFGKLQLNYTYVQTECVKYFQLPQNLLNDSNTLDNNYFLIEITVLNNSNQWIYPIVTVDPPQSYADPFSSQDLFHVLPCGGNSTNPLGSCYFYNGFLGKTNYHALYKNIQEFDNTTQQYISIYAMFNNGTNGSATPSLQLKSSPLIYNISVTILNKAPVAPTVCCFKTFYWQWNYCGCKAQSSVMISDSALTSAFLNGNSWLYLYFKGQNYADKGNTQFYIDFTQTSGASDLIFYFPVHNDTSLFPTLTYYNYKKLKQDTTTEVALPDYLGSDINQQTLINTGYAIAVLNQNPTPINISAKIYWGNNPGGYRDAWADTDSAIVAVEVVVIVAVMTAAFLLYRRHKKRQDPLFSPSSGSNSPDKYSDDQIDLRDKDRESQKKKSKILTELDPRDPSKKMTKTFNRLNDNHPSSEVTS
jgi:hypothetical protein